MNRTLRWVIACLAIVILCINGMESLRAQSARYELGRRLKKFELAWESSSAERRALSTSSMESAVERFFGLRLAEAGRALDEARTALADNADTASETQRQPSTKEQWADSLSLVVQPLLADSSSTSLQIKLSSFYSVEYQPASDLQAEVRIFPANFDSITWGAPNIAAGSELTERRTTLPVEKFLAGMEHTIPPLPEGDYWVQVNVVDKAATYEVGQCLISRINALDDRLNALKLKITDPRASNEASTARHIVSILESLKRNQIQEIDYPATKLIQQAEALTLDKLSADSKPNPSPLVSDFSGTAWLRLNGEKSSSVVRIYVPNRVGDKSDPPKKYPVLFAFHGAGGSENMFFETYGAGRLVELAAARGWIVVAPRQGLIGGIGLTAEQQLQILSNYFPIDQSKVFFVGHSMGAAQLIQQVQASPNLPVAVAALGGGQRVGPFTKASSARWFVAAGERDFGKRGALALRSALEHNGQTVKWQEYKDVEHMVVVQAALDDVFEFFDKTTLQPHPPEPPAPETPK